MDNHGQTGKAPMVTDTGPQRRHMGTHDAMSVNGTFLLQALHGSLDAPTNEEHPHRRQFIPRRHRSRTPLLASRRLTARQLDNTVRTLKTSTPQLPI